jgi:hypothetical protein
MAWKQLVTFVTEMRQPAIDAIEKGTRSKWSTFWYKSMDDMLYQLGDPKAEQLAWNKAFEGYKQKYDPIELKQIKGKIDLMLATRRDLRSIYGAGMPVRPRVELDVPRLAHNSMLLSQARVNDMVKRLGA